MPFRLAAIVVLPLAMAAQEPAGTHPEFVWQGDVNDVCVLRIHQDRVEATDGNGQAVNNGRYKFWSKLPDTNQTVRLNVLHGRGVVRFLSQPRLENDYTATIRIDDPQPGASHYSIALRWAVSQYDQAGKIPKPKNTAQLNPAVTAPFVGAITWSGHVDGTVRVSIRGDSSYAQVVSGALTGERADIVRALPRDSGLKYTVVKRSGGGEVQVVEIPSEANGYTVTFEVRNGESANSDYTVEVGWAGQAALR